MDEDIVPALLESIQKDFDSLTFSSPKLKSALQLLNSNKATYIDVNDFAIEIGEILAQVLNTHVTVSVLPDGKMYFNIAERLLNATMKKNHELISGFAVDVQTKLNQAAGIRLKSQVPELNQDRIDGIVNKISDAESFEDVIWLLNDPIINFSQSVVDEAIKANASFHAKAGLQPKIERKIDGRNACKWCRALAGIYNHNETPDDIYRRHERCRCTVDYKPKDGKRQNVWSKTFKDPKKLEKINQRKMINVKERSW